MKITKLFLSIIPEKLFERIGETIGNANFQTVFKYITYFLDREFSSAEERVFSKEDKEKN